MQLLQDGPIICAILTRLLDNNSIFFSGEKRALKVMKLPTALTREAWALHFDHPNIIRTVDVSQTSPKSEYVLIVMEFVGTDTLQIFIDDQEDLMDLRQCLKYMLVNYIV